MTEGIEDFAEIKEDEKPERGSVFTCRRNQEPEQLECTLVWVDQNYEWADGVCLPRCVLYYHYQDYCRHQKYIPVGPATFGKVLRMRFPKLTTRRLGARGQSKYHYYGIGIKESSIYYKDVYTGKGLSRFSTTKVKTETSSRKFSNPAKNGRVLPLFPDLNGIVFENEEVKEKVETFMMMYRSHCQRILDTVISASLDEVRKLFVHFWQSLPDHMVPLLSSELIRVLISHCDILLYNTLNDVLVPNSCVQNMPESLLKDVKNFVNNLMPWLERALEDAPHEIKTVKLEGADRFCRSMRRNLDFIHLAKATKGILIASAPNRTMHIELTGVDINAVWLELSYLSLPVKVVKWTEALSKTWTRLVEMLSRPVAVEDLLEWLEGIIDTFVFQPAGQSWKTVGWDFILVWSYLTKAINRELTLKSSPSFASFQVLHMMFDDYIQIVLENRMNLEINKQIEFDLSKFYQPFTYEKRKGSPVSGPMPTKLGRGSPSFSEGSDETSFEDVDEVYGRVRSTEFFTRRDQKYSEVLLGGDADHYVLPPSYSASPVGERAYINSVSSDCIIIDESFGLSFSETGVPHLVPNTWREHLTATQPGSQQDGLVLQQNDVMLSPLTLPFYPGYNLSPTQLNHSATAHRPIELDGKYFTSAWATHSV